jgi:hypothetical protein
MQTPALVSRPASPPPQSLSPAEGTQPPLTLNRAGSGTPGTSQRTSYDLVGSSTPPRNAIPEVSTEERRTRIYEADLNRIIYNEKVLITRHPNPPNHIEGFEVKKIHGYSAESMVYELFKVSANEKLTTELALLQRGQNALYNTRANFPYGRGNVISDIEASDHQAALRMVLTRFLIADSVEHFGVRGIAHHERIAISAAAAEETKGAYCSDFAAVALLNIAKGTLQAHESAMIDCNRKHCWAELVGSSGDAVIVDAWTDGPAVLAQDYAYESLRFEKEPNFDTINKEEVFGGLKKIHSQSAKILVDFYNEIKSVFRVSFKQDFHLNIEDSYVTVYTLPVLAIDRALFRKCTPPNKNYIGCMIQAVGVLRRADQEDSRMSVQQAINAAPELISEARKMYDKSILAYGQTNL